MYVVSLISMSMIMQKHVVPYKKLESRGGSHRALKVRVEEGARSRKSDIDQGQYPNLTGCLWQHHEKQFAWIAG